MLATARTVEPARAMALGLTTGPQLVGGSAGLTMTGVSPGMMGGAGGLREGAYGLSPAMGGRLGDQPSAGNSVAGATSTMIAPMREAFSRQRREEQLLEEARR